MGREFRAAAVLCVRNEALHIKRCIDCLVQDGIEVYVIDHSSTDGTAELAGSYVGRGVIDVRTMDYDGTFSLARQLEMKHLAGIRLSHDWLIHIDADEWLHPRSGESLLYALERADRQGDTAVEFDEMVFSAIGSEDFRVPDYHRQMLHYYFYTRRTSPLFRAWKNREGLQNVTTGGHALTGGKLNLHSEKFILRHYVCLSREQFIEKYVARMFPAGEVTRGWHFDRERIKQGYLWAETEEGFLRLPAWDSRAFDASVPKTKHFWEQSQLIPRGQREA